MKKSDKRLKMKKRCIPKKMVVSFMLATAAVCAILCEGETGAEIIDKIIAVVNDDIITLSELKEITVPYLKRMRAKYSLDYNEEQIRETERRILDQLIDERLVKQELVRLEIKATEKEITIAVKDMMESSNLSEDQFKKALAEQGLTLEKYREQMKYEMERMRLLDMEIRSKIQIKDKEVEEYYKEHMASYNTPPEVRLQQILLIVPPEADEEAIKRIREKAEEIAQKIKNGENFNKMVKLYSQDSSAATGGDIGFFKQGELQPAIDKVAFSLYLGEASAAIQTSAGFHIIKVLDKREKQKMTEEERKKEIESILYNQGIEDNFKQWLKELRKKAFIQINL